jgi:protein-disulfide isomerase
VSLVEFGDYECGFCGAAQPIVREVIRRLARRLLFGFRHFPMAQAHPHAFQAAAAAEAAGAQGRFWAFHEKLFASQHALETEDLLGYARALDLDLERFADDLASEVTLAKVRSDFRSGVRSGVNGTPTFFIDEVRYDGRWDLDALTGALDRTLARKTLTTSQP